MHAVLGIDLQSRPVVFGNYLVHAGGAIALFRRRIQAQVSIYRNFFILERQVAGLIFFMVGI